MDIAEYKNIYFHEQSHFFYVSTHDLVLLLIKKYTLLGKKISILDAGCGTGLLGKKMQQFGTVTGIDVSSEAVKYAKKRGLNARLGTITQLPFKNGSFDVVTCIDVLYHQDVEKDTLALKEIKRVLKEDGILILRVSAHHSLASKHDKTVHLKYRSSRMEFQKLLEKQKFKVLKLSYIHLPLYPLDLVKSFVERIFFPQAKESVISSVHPKLNAFLIKILCMENRIVVTTDIPQGIALIAVCKK